MIHMGNLCLQHSPELELFYVYRRTYFQYIDPVNVTRIDKLGSNKPCVNHMRPTK